MTRSSGALPTVALAMALAAAALLAGFALACRPDESDRSTEALVRRHCARCHGIDGRGNRRAVARQPGLDLTRSELAARGDRDELHRWIAEGEGTMPGFAEKLSPEEIERMIDWAVELTHEGSRPVPAAER
jgi:mono/diheme cytochrome c family protein